MENLAKESVKIAVTSQNYKTVTKHAGLSRKLLVYSVSCPANGSDPASKIEEVDRISLSKDMALHTCKPSIEHPIDVADILICGSCGEGFIRKMGKRGIIVSVATKSDPIEAIQEFLENGERHYTCDGPHQTEIKRHPNCPHNKKHAHDGEHEHEGSGCGCGGHHHDHNHEHGNCGCHDGKHGALHDKGGKCGCGSGCACHGKKDQED